MRSAEGFAGGRRSRRQHHNRWFRPDFVHPSVRPARVFSASRGTTAPRGYHAESESCAGLVTKAARGGEAAELKNNCARPAFAATMAESRYREWESSNVSTPELFPSPFTQPRLNGCTPVVDFALHGLKTKHAPGIVLWKCHSRLDGFSGDSACDRVPIRERFG